MLARTSGKKGPQQGPHATSESRGTAGAGDVVAVAAQESRQPRLHP